MIQILSKKYIKRLPAFFACFFFLLSGFMPAAAQMPANKTVRAGVFYFDGYHMKDEDGTYTGYGFDFLNLVSEYSHLNFEYKGYDKSWEEMLTMLENGEIDMVTSARKTQERESKFAFSLPIGRNNTILFVHADNSKFYSGDYETYNGMKIGLLSGSSQNKNLSDFAREKGFSYQAIEYQDSGKLAKDLQDGRIDAILSSNLRRTDNEKALETIQSDNFYAIVRKGDTKLLNEINYAIDQMNINEGDWSNVIFYKYYGHTYGSTLTFTEREKEYIQDVISGRKKITAISIGDREPYSYVENGEMKGILPEYFAKVMEIAGLPYELIIPKDREEYYNTADSNGVDIVIDKRTSSTASQNHPYLGFHTDSYMSTGVAKVTRKDFSGSISTVAIADVQGESPLEDGLTGNAKILRYPNRETAMQAVIDGKADAAYVYTYTAQLFVNNDYTNSLHFNIISNMRFLFKMYVRNSSDHELVTILNKCIHQMPDDTINQLITKYTSYAPETMSFGQYMQAHPKTLALSILLISLALGVITALYLRMRWNKKIISATEQANLKLEEQLSIVDALSHDYVNVYAVNAKNGTASIIKMEGFVPSGCNKDSKNAFPYHSVLQKYISDRVHPEDKAYLTDALALDTVCRKLNSDTEYSGNYRIYADHKVHNFQFTYVKTDKVREQKDGCILAGFRNIDDIVSKEQEQKEVLAKALAAAQHANAAKTTFLNNMSHDIRTPMNAIIGFTSLAASHIENQEQVKSYLEKILTSSKHLLSLINDVLDMSRIESGKVSIEEKEASLPEIIHDLKTIVQADVKAKQLTFYLNTLDVTNETIICDRLRLNQVLLNILSNAMKYTKPGGTVSVRIIQMHDAPKGYASYQFRIKDTGIGMSKEFQQHLFEPFEREQTATISGIQGTGLGLAITKNIIDMMNGTVTVESEEGKGTEFIVSFQFRTPGNAAETEYLEQLANLRALVVDDDINTCMSVSKMLSSIGMRPDWTTRGTEAIAHTEFAIEQNDPYSFYIMDWMIPDLSGLETVRRIRAIIGSGTPITVLTSYDWSDIEEEAKKAGVTAFYSKPLFASKLRELLTAPYRKADQQSDEDASRSLFSGKRILLAEDNDLNQEIATTILEEYGFVIDTADDGTEAVEIIEQSPEDMYDLILMDIQMPIMNGYDAAQAIRAMENPVKSAIPIVAMTANAFEEDKKRAADAGMNGHVAKPIDTPVLIETLLKILKP